MSNVKVKKKLVTFAFKDDDLKNISQDMENGWSITNLVQNNDCYVAIMEFPIESNLSADSFFVPPRKKLKILQ